MNAKQYADYRADVAQFLARNNVKPGCFAPKHQEPEPSFSWQPCGCCGSPLGGNREDYAFACKDGTIFEASICSDCVYSLTYDRLDDATMDAIESEES
jgi:hypothetical protein